MSINTMLISLKKIDDYLHIMSILHTFCILLSITAVLYADHYVLAFILSMVESYVYIKTTVALIKEKVKIKQRMQNFVSYILNGGLSNDNH